MKAAPDHHDAELVLKTYDLRREEVMRQSRDSLNRSFWPKSYEEFVAIADMGHPLNAAFRQVSTYWEMVYSFARHGVVNGDFFVENNGEGIFLYAKVLPYLEQFRREGRPTAFMNAEWVCKNTEAGRQRLDMLSARVKQMLQDNSY
jgi:hypothetical protein